MHTADGTPVHRFPLAKDDIGIAQTVLTMQQLIDAGSRSPEIRELAVDVVRQAGIGERDSHGEVRAIFDWVKHNFRFTKDPAGKETLGSAHYLMRLRAGDCDDYVVMLGSLLTALGYPVRIVTIAADPNEPRRFSHVYMRVAVDGRQIGLDATQSYAVPGWEPPKYFRLKEWGTMLRQPSHRAISGMGNYARVARRNPHTGLGAAFGTVWEAIGPAVTAVAQAGATRLAYGKLPYYSQYGGAPYGQPGAPSIYGGGSFAVGSPYGQTNWQSVLPWILGAGVVALVLMRK